LRDAIGGSVEETLKEEFAGLLRHTNRYSFLFLFIHVCFFFLLFIFVFVHVCFVHVCFMHFCFSFVRFFFFSIRYNNYGLTSTKVAPLPSYIPKQFSIRVYLSDSTRKTRAVDSDQTVINANKQTNKQTNNHK